jgi:hypothetical protein
MFAAAKIKSLPISSKSPAFGREFFFGIFAALLMWTSVSSTSELFISSSDALFWFSSSS